MKWFKKDDSSKVLQGIRYALLAAPPAPSLMIPQYEPEFVLKIVGMIAHREAKTWGEAVSMIAQVEAQRALLAKHLVNPRRGKKGGK